MTSESDKDPYAGCEGGCSCGLTRGGAITSENGKAEQVDLLSTSESASFTASITCGACGSSWPADPPGYERECPGCAARTAQARLAKAGDGARLRFACAAMEDALNEIAFHPATCDALKAGIAGLREILDRLPAAQVAALVQPPKEPS